MYILFTDSADFNSEKELNQIIDCQFLQSRKNPGQKISSNYLWAGRRNFQVKESSEFLE